jgi:DnaA family protein
MGEQLALAVQLRDSAELDLFHPGPNTEALQAVTRASEGEPPQRLLLHGPLGCGRTHLLQAAVRHASRRGRRGAYLPLGEQPSSTEILDGYSGFDLLALDDVDSVITDRDWAIAVARLLDVIRTHDCTVLIATTLPPDQLDIALPDLRTRLAASAVFPLKPLDDEDRRLLLQQRARARGLELADGVADFLVRRLPRDGSSLMQVLDLLDRASLTAQRRLTLPFVQAALAQTQQVTPESGD